MQMDPSNRIKQDDDLIVSDIYRLRRIFLVSRSLSSISLRFS